MSFDKVRIFEEKIASFFGAPYAVAVDCCTHGVELSLRLTNATEIQVQSEPIVDSDAFRKAKYKAQLGLRAMGRLLSY